MRINTNVSALNAHKNLTQADNRIGSSLERLSSGLRINRAADDGSGMTIADSLRSQGLGLGQAIRNANDGINIVQTADAALEESINIINTIKQKSIQAAQDGQTTETRAVIQADIDKLLENLDTIANTTSFNNQKLLSGAFTNKQFQVGAYTGETVNISISASQSSRIGHVTTSNLTLKDNQPGVVDLAIYSNTLDQTFDVEAVNVQYNNSRESGMGAVADAINRLSDTLGISATAFVRSTTDLAVSAGTTDSDFAINGVNIGQVNVQNNDSDGALVKSINQKTAQHGVFASVDTRGHLTLTSTDGRAIQVNTGGQATDDILRNTQMSTVGHVQLTQMSASEIVVNNAGGGDVVSLTNNLDVQRSDAYTMEAEATRGSRLAATSTLGAGWKTNQDIVTSSAFTGDITTTQTSSLEAGSVLAGGSTAVFQGTVHGDVTLAENSKLTTAPSTLALYSDIKSGSTLAAGTTFTNGVSSGGGVKLAGESVIEATGQTFDDNTIKSASTLAAGTVLAANTTLSGVSVTIEQTAKTVGDSDIKSGSSLTAGSIIGSNSDLTGNSGTITIEATGNTMGTSTIGSGSTLQTGTVLGNGTLIENVQYTSGTSSVSGVKIMATGPVTQESNIASGSTLKAGTLLTAGTFLSSGTTITGMDGTSYGGSGVTLTEDVVLQADAIVRSGVTRANVGSTLANNTVLGDQSQVYADLTLAAETKTVSGTLTLANNSSLAGGSILKESQVATDLTLRNGTTLNSDVTLKTGSMLADGSNLKEESEVATDITLKANADLTGDLLAGKGSSFAAGTRLEVDSIIHADVTLQKASTLTEDMNNILAEVTLGTGSILAEDSTIKGGSIFHGSVEVKEDVYLARKTELGAGSTIIQEGSFIKAGSTIGGNATLDQALNVTGDGFTLGVGTKLTQGSQLANGSTFGGSITLANNETVKGQMQVAQGSTLAEGTKITAGTYLSNDIRTADGIMAAGTVLKEDITTVGTNRITRDMTLQDGSVINEGSILAANVTQDSATAQLDDRQQLRLSELSVLTQEDAQNAIAIADSALKDLDKIRTDLGSVQNQLTSTVANISTTRVNVMAAESTIRDVDFAEESSNFTKMQVLMQAGTFAMAQANASAQNVMSLLQ
ncbi:flagellin [Desulfobotulus alkaliphilus]|uniref:Flagellin n=1 Tax=Desulfobotulus alkaliphilus TaxID=622671 RepID=A0A562RTD7_9BACT|nr:flagellin [Desulfobotulus alkaliphilus]TWI72375.1 flagellin [Desulfobotulus alkaliphilus]